MEKIEVRKSKTLGRNVVRVLALIVREDPLFLYVAIPASAAATLLGYAVTWISALFINKITSSHFDSIFDARILWLVLAYIFIPFIIDQLRQWYNHRYAQFYNKISQYIDILFLRTQERIDVQTHEDSVFANMRAEANANQHKVFNFAQAIFGMTTSGVAVLVSIIILAQYNALLTFFIIIAFIPQLFGQAREGKRIWAIWGGRVELRRKFNEYSGYFVDTPNLTEMKIMSAADHWIALIQEVLSIFNTEIRSAESHRYYVQVLGGLCSITAIAVVTFVLMKSVVAGTLAIGTFIFLESQILAVQSQVSNAVFSLAGILSDNLFISNIFAYLDTPNVLKDGTENVAPGAPRITFKDVSFRYPGSDTDVLHSVSLSIEKGEKVAIVGVNGAGKTTFSKLLMRFYDPTGGSVEIDGLSLTQARLNSWHAHIGYLSQEYAKYRLPVAQAIAVGNPTIPFSQERVEEAARRAGADTFIEEWVEKYKTPLGRQFDGVEPSVGQWQKLALARLFYKDPDIWILDEPTSSIDAVAELEIFRELENLPKDKTVILISHRFNTVRNADKIIVIGHGTIEEIGSHDELMTHNGTYANLFTTQKESYDS